MACLKYLGLCTIVTVALVAIIIGIVASSHEIRKYTFAQIYMKLSPHSNALAEPYKKQLFNNIHGKVLEIGAGTGCNFPFFPHDINWIGTEPNPHLYSHLKQLHEEKSYFPSGHFELHNKTGEELMQSLDSETFDYVVITLVLCSVDDPMLLLQEVKRVLKTNGKLLFLEHVAYPEGTWSRIIQHCIKPLWKIIGDGCESDRDTGKTLKAVGFSHVDYSEVILDMALPIKVISGLHIWGTATK